MTGDGLLCLGGWCDIRRLGCEWVKRWCCSLSNWLLSWCSTSHETEARWLGGDLGLLTAIDADVIKTYVSLNMGIGLIAEMAYDSTKDNPMVSKDVSHLFPLSTTYIGIRRDNFLRKYTSDFIQMFIPQTSEKELKQILNKRHPKL